MKKITVFLLIGLFILFSGCGAEIKESEIISEAEAKTTTVYITKTGECYHQSECSYLSKSKLSRTLNNIANRYRPCQHCYPPIIED